PSYGAEGRPRAEGVRRDRTKRRADSWDADRCDSNGVAATRSVCSTTIAHSRSERPALIKLIATKLYARCLRPDEPTDYQRATQNKIVVHCRPSPERRAARRR